MESKTKIAKLYTQNELEKQFEYVNSLIEQHRISAVVNVNVEVLLTSWKVGKYISKQLKSSNWGTKIVAELADYLKIQNPKRKGFSKRNLYNMIKFYETYSQIEFLNVAENLQLAEIVQLPTAQLTTSEINQDMPLLLTLTTFTNHIEIMNRCNSYEERIFYMLYASKYSLKTDETRRCIVNQTYLSLMSKDKMLSPKMKAEYSNVEFILKDKAFVDFLNLPSKHNERHLHIGLLEHMKEFILELGKDFLFVESEYGVQVGGSVHSSCESCCFSLVNFLNMIFICQQTTDNSQQTLSIFCFGL